MLTILGAVPGAPFRGFTICYLWFLLTCAIATGIIAVSPVNPVYIWVPGAFLGGAPVVLLVLALYSRSFARAATDMREELFWLRWQYQGDEWARFEEYVWRETQRETRMARYFTLGLVVIGGGVAGLASRDLLLGAVIGGVLFLCGLGVMGQTYLVGLHRYRRRHQAAGEVRVGPKGVLQPRGFTPISSFNLSLIDAKVEPLGEPGPSMLRLVLGSMTEDSITRTSEFRVPIPYGRESEATELAYRLLGASAAGVS